MTAGAGSRPTGKRSGPGQARARPNTVEGSVVALDVHGEPGEPNHYKLFCVQCSVSSHGALCSKRRNIGSAQTVHFGEQEPLAFLGAWLRHGPHCVDRTAHMAFRPTLAQVQAYMAEHDWL